MASSTDEQDKNKWSIKIPIFGTDSWVICDKITTVAVSRLEIDKTGIQKLDSESLNAILAKVEEWLPSARPL